MRSEAIKLTGKQENRLTKPKEIDSHNLIQKHTKRVAN